MIVFEPDKSYWRKAPVAQEACYKKSDYGENYQSNNYQQSRGAENNSIFAIGYFHSFLSQILFELSF